MAVVGRWVAAMAMLTTFGMCSGAALAQTALPSDSVREIADATHANWRGERVDKLLEDRSTLSEYRAYTSDLNRADTRLTVSFVPRFECTPMLGITVDELPREVDASGAETTLWRNVDLLDDGDRLSIRIDRVPVPFPILLDLGVDDFSLWYSATRQDRQNLRLQVDAGDRAEIALSNASIMVFSLLGSRRSIAEAEAGCRVHAPTPVIDDSSAENAQNEG